MTDYYRNRHRVWKVAAFMTWTLLVFFEGHALRVWHEQHRDVHQVLAYCSDGLKRLLAEQEHTQ